VVVIARAAAGLSQTDGNLASVSGTVLGKHMPRASHRHSTLALRELRHSEYFVRSDVPCEMTANQSLFLRDHLGVCQRDEV